MADGIPALQGALEVECFVLESQVWWVLPRRRADYDGLNTSDPKSALFVKSKVGLPALEQRLLQQQKGCEDLSTALEESQG